MTKQKYSHIHNSYRFNQYRLAVIIINYITFYIDHIEQIVI